MAKKIQTAIAPATAPSSGRLTSLRSRPTLTSRSSTGRPPVVVVAPGLLMAFAPCRPGSADSLLAQVQHLRRRVLEHEARAGQDDAAATGHQQVLLVKGEEQDRQVALEELLLVDREEHVALVDGRQGFRREVERAELDLAQLAGLRERLDRRAGAGRSQRQDAVVAGPADLRRDLLLGVRGVLQV